MTSKIVVNNIEADAGVSTVTFNSNVVRGDSNLHSTGLALGAGSTVGAVTGVTTYYGDGSQLTNLSSSNLTGALPAISGANLTGIDATSVKHTDGNVKVQANNSGATVTGVITAVGGNSTEGAFLKGTAVGVGTTTTAGRNAGVGTANGTLTFNTSVGLQVYMGDTRGWKTVTPFITATGGSTSSADGYTIHTFTSSGAFTVTDGAPTCEFLIVGGGGAGGQDISGGGGAGGFVEGTITLPGPGTFPVTVGDGGSNATGPGDTPAPGGNSVIAFPSNITALGGGRGVGNPHFAGSSTSGGSSGGGVPTTGTATQPGANSGVSGITQYGNVGGNWPGPGGNGGGGGGAGGAGSPDGYGGVGRASSISGTSVTYAGGGDGADQPNGKGGPGQYGNPGGAGYNNGSPGPQPHRNGAPGTGGGGAAGYGSWGSGGNGGPGIVIIRY